MVDDALAALEQFKASKAAFYGRTQIDGRAVQLADVTAAAERYRELLAAKIAADRKKFRRMRVPSFAEMMR